MTNLAIATPAYGETFYAPYIKSIIGLQRLIDRRGWGSSFTTVSYADVVEARNFLLTLWFDQSKATHCCLSMWTWVSIRRSFQI